MSRTTVRRHRWSVTPRDGRRLSARAWRFVVNFEIVDLTTGRVIALQTARGHAHTLLGARHQIAKVLAG